jgi:hypothetical protein
VPTQATPVPPKAPPVPTQAPPAPTQAPPVPPKAPLVPTQAPPVPTEEPPVPPKAPPVSTEGDLVPAEADQGSAEEQLSAADAGLVPAEMRLEAADAPLVPTTTRPADTARKRAPLAATEDPGPVLPSEQEAGATAVYAEAVRPVEGAEALTSPQSRAGMPVGTGEEPWEPQDAVPSPPPERRGAAGWSSWEDQLSRRNQDIFKYKKFQELPPAARLELVRKHGLCELCLGRRSPGSKRSHKECRWRNQIWHELCQEQKKCRRRQHRLLHMEDLRSLQAARPAKPAKPPDRLRKSSACSRAEMSRGVPAAGEEMLPTSGMSAGATAVATDEERRAALKAAYQARLAGVRGRHHAQLAAMKQRLPPLELQLQEVWQDVGGARRPAPTKVHLRATAAVDERLEKAETLLRFTEDYLEPVEECLMKAEVYLRSAREHLEAAETQLTPAEAPPISTVKAVAGTPHSGRLEAGEDTTSVLRNEVQAARWHGMPSQQPRRTHLRSREQPENSRRLLADASVSR